MQEKLNSVPHLTLERGAHFPQGQQSVIGIIQQRLLQLLRLQLQGFLFLE